MATKSSDGTLSPEHPFPGLLSGFVESTAKFPSRPALVVNGKEYSYKELSGLVGRVAATISQFQPQEYPLGALLAMRSLTAYAGMLGILASGKGYVPLNPKFPVDRNTKMLQRSGARVLVVDEIGRPQLESLLAEFAESMTVIFPEIDDVEELSKAFPNHRFIGAKDMPTSTPESFVTCLKSSSTAYLLFTSGSTGEPKGVPISHLNVCSYVRPSCEFYRVTENDRFSQEFDLTFDLSVHDMFLAWERGAALYCIPEKSVMAPAKFIRDSKLTMWFSVPSVASMLSRMRLLAAGSFPTLRFSLFCGEPLPAAYAQQWQEAAPNSIVENLYGPTEATIAITRYRWDPNSSLNESPNGIAPIGWAFEGQHTCVVSEDFHRVPAGESGELCLGGSQVTTGYWHDPQKSAEQFVRLPEGGDRTWYRTGDLVNEAPDGCLKYVGRIDHQVKIRGYRVELQEVEGVLRKACATEQVAAIPWPVSNGNVEGIVAFICANERADVEKVLTRCREILPDYMVPKKIHQLEEMPLNANGKTDRKRLATMLKEGQF